MSCVGYSANRAKPKGVLVRSGLRNDAGTIASRAVAVLLYPVADGFGILRPQIGGRRIQQNDDDVTPVDIALHDDAAPRFGNETCFLQADIPFRAVDEAVGIVEAQHFSLHGKVCTGVGGVVANQGITVSRLDQQSQIVRTGLVGTGQSGWLHITCFAHTQHERALVHGANRCAQAAGIGAPQGMGGTVLARHQGQMQQLLPRQRGAYSQTRAAAFEAIHIFVGDGDHFVHGQVGIHGDDCRHQLGDGCNGRNEMSIFIDQYLPCFLIHGKGHAGVQIGSEVATVLAQTLNLPQAVALWHGNTNDG